MSNINLADQSINDLRKRATAAGVEAVGSKEDIIARLIEAEEPKVEEAEPGVLFSLSTPDDDARSFIKSARSHIAVNKQAGSRVQLFLQNREGTFYDTWVSGCRVTTPAHLEKILKLVVMLPDGSQEKILADFKSDSKSFDTPMLAIVRRAGKDGKWGSFTMLYLKRKQKIAASSF
jgi:hypothetical protein